jgi:hypothetical protein
MMDRDFYLNQELASNSNAIMSISKNSLIIIPEINKALTLQAGTTAVDRIFFEVIPYKCTH